ncbi:MAG: 3-methyl-2-oxobutanoate hydroxymethyltransferase [Halothiobacillaceae bacterium]|nr:3-methyl-2-oxobutanoate hydroxymethyltransferase [Halothiobacillaceae bacterium]
MTSPQRPISVTTLAAMKRRGERITCLTAYDASLARVMTEAGVDMILVGDSLGMVVQGHDTTLPVTLDEMIYHSRCVARGMAQTQAQTSARQPLLLVDLPFMSYASVEQALHSAARLMKEGGAQMVKLEGGAAQVAVVQALTAQGIPVCAHLGLTPQSVHKLGGYKVQGREASAAEAMLHDALALQQAGADTLILECIPSTLAARISHELAIPVIGIGAGADCDGQVLVTTDVLGLSAQPPRFARDYTQTHGAPTLAIRAFIEDVRAGVFPQPEQCFS